MTVKSTTASFGTVSRVNHDAQKFYQGRIYDEFRTPTPPQAKTKAKPRTKKPAKKPDNSRPLPDNPRPLTEVTDNPQITRNQLHCADSQNMHHLPDGSVHLMITSPPYNVGKDYDDDLSFREYMALLQNVIQETARVLVDGGRACINIANIGRKPYIPLHAYLTLIALECGFNMRGEIIWDKGASAGSSCAWGSWQSASNPVLRDVHEYILIFSKGDYQRKPIGDNSISKQDFLDHTKSVWRFPTTSAKKAKHPAPFPIELPKRLIELYSYKNDIILDPFIGSGTTALAAQQLGRDYIGYEISEDYINIAAEKLREGDYQPANY